MKSSRNFRILLAMLLVGMSLSIQAANVEIAAVGTNTNKLVVPIAENQDLKKIGQKVEIKIKVRNDFEGYVTITNNSTSEIDFWKSKDGDDTVSNTFNIDIHQGQLYPTDVAPKDFFVKGIIESTAAEIEAELVKTNSPNSGSKHKVKLKVAVPKIGIRQVLFDEEGAGCIPLTDDSGVAAPSSGLPQWRDGDDNGVINGVIDDNYSVAYVKGSTPKIGCKMKIDSPDEYQIKIKGSCSNGISILEDDAHPDEQGEVDELAVLDPDFTAGDFDDTIKFYGKSDPDGRPAFKITWETQIDDGEWVEFATTKHQVYVTLDAFPSIAKNRETLFYLACNKPSGNDGSNALSVVNLIYEEFSDNLVYRIDPYSGDPDNSSVLKYHGGGAGIHILERLGGSCGAFADFLQEVLSVQDISSATYGVVCRRTGHTPSNFYSNFFVLKEVNITGGTDTEPTRISIPAHQGLNAAPSVQTQWYEHRVVKAANNYYDPSYGTGPFPSQADWENGSIDALQGKIINPLIPDIDPYWIPDSVALDVLFEVFEP